MSISSTVLKIIAVLFICFTGMGQAYGQMGDGSMNMGPKEGRYFGYIKPDGKNWKIPVSLDLIVVQEKDEYAHLRGVFKIMLGGFNSYEYVNQFFDEVIYSFMSNQLTFDSTLQEISITNSKVHMMGQELTIMGEFRSSSANINGKINLVYVKNTEDFSSEVTLRNIFPNVEVLNSLTGEYKGKCGRERVKLQIEASKFKASADLSMNPFYGYAIKGRLASNSMGICSDNKYCHLSNFSSGSYNFYRGNLRLSGHPKSLSCKVSKLKLDCGECKLQKVENFGANLVDKNKKFTVFPRSEKIQTGDFDELPEFPEPSDLKGNYVGYVHHETQNRYQPLRLNVKAFKSADRPNRPETLYLAASSWLYFGDENSEEMIAYKYEKRSYLSTFPNFMFEGSGETFMKITEWTSGSIKGDWYSKAFGRVGTVELLRGNQFPDLGNQKMIMGLTGKYDNHRSRQIPWEIELFTQFNSEADMFSAEFFYPLEINGSARIPNVTSIMPVETGVFDFYTNTFTFKISDGRIVTGTTTEGGMKIFLPSRPISGVVLSDYRMKKYRLGN